MTLTASTAESIVGCFYVGLMNHLALRAIVVVYFCHPDQNEQLCVISKAAKENTMKAKQKGFIGDICDSES